MITCGAMTARVFVLQCERGGTSQASDARQRTRSGQMWTDVPVDL